MALATLQRRDAISDGWRREFGPRLPQVARLLFQLVPPTAAGPLLLDPISNGLEDGLDTVLPHVELVEIVLGTLLVR